ncbi:TonB-dependent receptor domain-containing protein [Sphingobacterium griseoflavum]|uniref:TonB-dependent receptor n=1 Tax=Sphingobacterium griseoflavum TaxID=1474952 RepID=A0ABQ3HRB9_9SPHI|nr:TonB-dependent receptor [Sphingobacterium griseoflavum]GHE23793.1 TonB-dependent receptor [Sphingobacterium griseoflavum]
MKQNSIFFLTISMLLFFFTASAQQPKIQTYAARVLAEGQAVAAATVRVDKQIVHSDQQGNFTFSAISGSTIHIEISAVGNQMLEQDIFLHNRLATPLLFHLKKDEKQIEKIEVVGFTKIQEVNRQAYNVTAIDATKLYNTTMNISSALDRVAGIRVRESGGLGSNFNLSLNGFSGNHIRYFMDGIPMDNFGSSFQINNIPINMAERVEVYKGVVPIWLGADALGGAINIVTSTKPGLYVDASYGYGSFNTHRTAVNAGYTSKKGFMASISAYQNYSDNDYKVTVEVADIKTGDNYQAAGRVRRFHDTYHNEAIIAQLGVVNKPYADKLLLGITVGQSYKEIQTGARMVSVFGGIHNEGNTIMPTLKYQKSDLIKGLDLTFNANFNLGTERSIDTLNRRYGWYGDWKETGANGGERSRQLYEYKNNEGIATLTANYKILARHAVALSNVATTFNRIGKNKLDPQSSALELGKKSFKDILGIGYSYDVDGLWSTTVFGKLLYQQNKNADISSTSSTEFGYGLASTYFPIPTLQLKTSYEMTNRLPTPYELFGDVENQQGNFNLKPEHSHNINLGAIYNWKVNDEHRFSMGANLIYRYAFDYIYNRFNANQTLLIADNREGVATTGTDAEFRYSYKKLLTFGGAITYQHLVNKQKYEEGYTGVSPLYNDQMPNIPYLFGNTDLGLSFRDLGTKGNVLNIHYNMLYVHSFWLYWPSLGSTAVGAEKKEIPKQLSHDLSFVYSLKNGKYNVGLEVNNIAGTQLYDNFSLQKPGRSFMVNLRYYFNKK